MKYLLEKKNTDLKAAPLTTPFLHLSSQTWAYSLQEGLIQTVFKFLGNITGVFFISSIVTWTGGS